MSAQTETLGYGTAFYYGDTADYATATTWTLLFSEPTDIKPPSSTVGEVESKHFLSPAMTDQKTPGWRKTGDMEITAHFIYSEVVAARGFNGAVKAFKLVYPASETNGISSSSSSNGVCKFNGFIKEVVEKPKLDGLTDVEVKIAITGVISWS